MLSCPASTVAVAWMVIDHMLCKLSFPFAEARLLDDLSGNVLRPLKLLIVFNLLTLNCTCIIKFKSSVKPSVQKVSRPCDVLMAD